MTTVQVEVSPPPPAGHPNNRSHSSITGTDEEVRLKLRDAAAEAAVDMGRVLEIVKTKRFPADKNES
jgi:hypothetical protein